MASPSIFVSYRRGDSAGHAGRLFDRLTARFAADRVFMDVEDIRPGEDFPKAIRDCIATCAVMVVVIGPQWLSLLRSRPAEATDYVCLEIETGLGTGAVVIPVLVGGALMPREAELPDTLRELSRREAVNIRDLSFDADVRRLIEAVDAVVHAGKAEAAIQLAGKWTARMTKRGQAPWTIQLELEAVADRLYGTVTYPTGVGSIQEGKIEGRRFSFHTSHVPRFATERAIIRFEGELAGGILRLLTSDDNGVAKGEATRDSEP